MNDIRINQILGEIYKRVYSSKKILRCCFKDCNSEAINSHYLQNNGILNVISNSGHLYEFKQKSPFSWRKGEYIMGFQRIGIKQALSSKLFCSKHDNDIFKSLESKDCTYSTYDDAIRLSYRVAQAELRKKQLALDIYSMIFDDDRLVNIDSGAIERMINGFLLGMYDLIQIVDNLWDEAQFSTDKFVFHYVELPRLEIYASSIFSPQDDELSNMPESLADLANVFIHLIPTKNCTKLIIGYDKRYANDWMIRYCSSWQDLSLTDIKYRISELLSVRIENWGMSENLYKNIPSEKLEKFIENSHENILNIDRINRSSVVNILD